MTRFTWLLAADMDGTVIPLEDTPVRRREVADFREVVEGAGHLELAYVTGRDLELALEGIRAFHLPRPAFLACDVGTSVYRRDGDAYVPDPTYVQAMQTAMGGVDADDLRRALPEVEGLRLQHPSRQGRFKVSLTFPGERAPEPFLAVVEERVHQLGARVTLVVSRDGITGEGLLDILPAGVAKDHAVRYLHDHTGVAEEHLVYAGDSGNDRAAMLAGYRVVVVANAPDELKASLRDEGRLLKIDDLLYFARRPYAAGVMEGLAHFGAI